LSIQQRIRGIKVLKAVSSPVRLQILNLLFDRGPLSYTELMSSLKMNPTRDAGRFAYHLKFLLKADLVEADVEAKKYCLTELGKTVIDISERIEKKASKPKGMLVRTSRLALEDFDANKIAGSLLRETKMPAELAQKVAKEAEKRLLKSKTKYLTAPLVREVVNAILIERGLEEYRHKLTRLGLPIYDVTALIDAKSKNFEGSASVHGTAGETVLKEYILLNVFPRDIADAHLSGSLYINGLTSWVLKPNEIMHDLRFFFQNGLNLEKMNSHQPSYSPPENFESTLFTAFNVLLNSAKEIGETQTIDYFNIFLAPFAKGMRASEITDSLRSFIANLSLHVNASLGIELTIPSFVADKAAIGPFGKHNGKYGEFKEESQVLASLILEILAEESARKPLLNPRIIVKVRPEAFTDDRAKKILLEAHKLASERSMLYFANLAEKSQENMTFSGSGLSLRADLNGDWEIDTLRTGCLGYVNVSLPRIIYDCGKDKAKFFEIFRERFEMAVRALEIKERMLRQRGKGLLPFLMQNVNGDFYFRLENCSRLINLVGLKESIEAFYGKSIYDCEKGLEFAEEISQNVQSFIRKFGRKRGRRLFTAMLPDFEASERLANLDIERYGVAKVRFSGTREKPFYSTINKLILKDGKIPSESLIFEQKTRGLHAGGNLAAIELGEVEQKPEELLALTKHVFEAYKIEFLTYNRKLTYCVNCKKSWVGSLHKCPSCGSTGTLAVFDRFASA
jgi:ribonucleoside-triphosphate reductase